MEVVGPWLQAFLVPVEFPLRSKSNFRRSPSDGGTWLSLSGNEGDLAVVIREARPDGWVLGSRDVALARRPVVVSVVAARTLLDAGNLSKGVLDAAQDVLYVNDASVVFSAGFAARGAKDQRAVLGFARLVPAAPLDAVLSCSSVLAELTCRALVEGPVPGVSGVS